MIGVNVPADKYARFNACSYAYTAALVSSLVAGAAFIYFIIKERLKIKNALQNEKIYEVLSRYHQANVEEAQSRCAQKIVAEQEAFKRTMEFLQPKN